MMVVSRSTHDHENFEQWHWHYKLNLIAVLMLELSKDFLYHIFSLHMPE